MIFIVEYRLPSGQSRSFTVDDLAVVGRGAGVDIVIPSVLVSRRHVELRRERTGRITFHDLQSRNGVFLNGSRVVTGTMTERDSLRVGNAIITIRVALDERETDSFRVEAQSGYWLEQSTRRLWNEGLTVGAVLSAQEFQLLSLLLAAAGDVVPRSVLGESLWGPGNFDNNMVHRLVRRAREKIEQHPESPELVIAVPGVGYYFNSGRASRD